MIGMPFQTAEDLADDLLFYQKFDAPMVGMGPYNPHPETPLTLAGVPYPSAERRFALGLKMIALLRLLMPDINIGMTARPLSLTAPPRWRIAFPSRESLSAMAGGGIPNMVNPVW